ncbi:MAG: helix-turn-helix domain-containing protein [Beijerinckiaceae bacterium]
MTKAGERLIQSAKEALDSARGDAAEKDFTIHVPPAFDVKALRKKLKLSQATFATRYGFGLSRLKDWEQGRSHPDSAIRAYLLVIAREPEAVQRALAAA